MIDSINPNLRSIEKNDGKTRKREFYAMSADSGYKILKAIAVSSGTLDNLVMVKPTEEQKAEEEEAKEIRTRITLPRTDWMMKQGIIKTGDVIYYKKQPSEEAEIINEYEVDYQGVSMTFLEFAKKMTGWDHVNHYRHLILKREKKTLFELRETKMNELGI